MISRPIAPVWARTWSALTFASMTFSPASPSPVMSRNLSRASVVNSAGRKAARTTSIGTSASIAWAAIAIERSISSIRTSPVMMLRTTGTVSSTRCANSITRLTTARTRARAMVRRLPVRLPTVGSVSTSVVPATPGSLTLSG